MTKTLLPQDRPRLRQGTSRGFYHDAIFVKRNNFNLLLHETFGGGFSPTAVQAAPPRAQSRARQR